MPDIEECCDDTPLEGVLELELGSEVRSVSMAWGFGLLGGLEFDMVDGGRDAGKDEREVLRGAPTLPCELGGGRGGGGAGSVVVDTLRLVVGCCRAILVALVLWYIGRLVSLLAILPSSSSSSYHARSSTFFFGSAAKWPTMNRARVSEHGRRSPSGPLAMHTRPRSGGGDSASRAEEAHS